MSHPRFMLDDNNNPRFDQSAMMEHVLARSAKLSPLDSQLVFREAYDTHFEIYDHDRGDPDRELASVEMHWAENTLIGSKLYERMKDYEKAGIYEYFKLSLKEFLDQEPHVVEFQIEYAVQRKEEETRRLAAAHNDLNKSFSKDPGKGGVK